jgi:uncharacterized protein
MRISIEDLGEGLHAFQVEEAPAALRLPTDEADFSAPVRIEGTLSVAGDNLVLQATVATEAAFECSRCLTVFTQELVGQIAVLYEKKADLLTGSAAEELASDDVEILPVDAKAIDLTHRAEEALHLAMPMKPLCREDCRGLCPTCGMDLNKGACGCRVEQADPRWQALKNLIKEE